MVVVIYQFQLFVKKLCVGCLGVDNNTIYHELFFLVKTTIMRRVDFFTLMAIVALTFSQLQTVQACTGITISSRNGAHVLARTIEWGGSELNSQYVVVPRGY